MNALARACEAAKHRRHAAARRGAAACEGGQASGDGQASLPRLLASSAPCRDAAKAGQPASTVTEPVETTADDPSEAAAIAEHGQTTEFAALLEVLTAPGHKIRGCQVDPARPKLQALQDVLGWTPSGYVTRPSPEMQERKSHDRLQVLLTYRQPPPPPPGQTATVAMYDYLCHTLFGVPVRPVGPEVHVPEMTDLEGKIVKPQWVECDWSQFESACSVRPTKVLQPNRYPYQLPRRNRRSLFRRTHEFHHHTQHWILWYFHGPSDPLPNPTEGEIDSDIRSELAKIVRASGFDHFDYIWYRNPGVSVPDVCHVQVFWIVPQRLCLHFV